MNSSKLTACILAIVITLLAPSGLAAWGSPREQVAFWCDEKGSASIGVGPLVAGSKEETIYESVREIPLEGVSMALEIIQNRASEPESRVAGAVGVATLMLGVHGEPPDMVQQFRLVLRSFFPDLPTDGFVPATMPIINFFERFGTDEDVAFLRPFQESHLSLLSRPALSAIAKINEREVKKKKYATQPQPQPVNTTTVPLKKH